MSEFRGNREEVLKKTRREVERLYTDYEQSGKERVGIDPELKEGIAVLLAMGMHTEASCWGHPERRDIPHMLSAEQNLFPYIDFSGYQSNDGLNEQGEAIGYSNQEVEAACARMKTDISTLKLLLAAFYQKHQTPLPQVTLRYFDDMPCASLVTRNAQHLASATRNEQDEAISRSRQEWTAFLAFIQNAYVQK